MWTDRTRLVLGEEALRRLSDSRVAVVGVGGVGAYCAEMLARTGVGHLRLIDADTIETTNLNRQLPALNSTLGREKTEVMRERILDINPDAEVEVVSAFVCRDNVADIVGKGLDYVVDAIDTLSPKIALIQYCLGQGLPLVSAMGAGAKTDATAVRLADISATRECPLAQQLRKRLHKLGVYSGFQAVFSEERPSTDAIIAREVEGEKSVVGTISYLPAVFGCVCAQAVILGISQK